jgi:hypothetical protein
MTVELAKIGRTGFKKASLLRRMGLPPNSRWGDVQKPIKERIVQARRNNDDEMAAFWSEVKVFLKRNLFKECVGCKATIKGDRTRCQPCQVGFKRSISNPRNEIFRNCVGCRKLIVRDRFRCEACRIKYLNTLK